MTQKALAIALVVMLAFASVATVSATTPTTVESTETTFSLSDADFENATQWTDGSTVSDFDANHSKGNYTEENVTSTDPAVRLVDNETGEVLKTWDAADLEQTFSNSTADDYAYRANVSHADLSGVDIRANETKDVILRYVDNASVSAENETYTNVTVTLTAADDYANFRVSDSFISTSDFVTFETDGFTILNSSFFADEQTHFEADAVTVNGTGSTVAVDMVNSTAQDRLSQSLDDVAESNWDKSTLITLETDDGKTYVKGYTALPDDVNASTDTYALIDESSGEVDIHLGEEFENTESVDVSVKTNVGGTDAFMRGLDLWVQDYEWSLDHWNPLTVAPDVGAFVESIDFDLGGDLSVPALGTLVPMAVGRRKLAE